MTWPLNKSILKQAVCGRKRSLNGIRFSGYVVFQQIFYFILILAIIIFSFIFSLRSLTQTDTEGKNAMGYHRLLNSSGNDSGQQHLQCDRQVTFGARCTDGRIDGRTDVWKQHFMFSAFCSKHSIDGDVVQGSILAFILHVTPMTQLGHGLVNRTQSAIDLKLKFKININWCLQQMNLEINKYQVPKKINIIIDIT